MKWCARRESNPHAFRHWFLRPACLPIPSGAHEVVRCVVSRLLSRSDIYLCPLPVRRGCRRPLEVAPRRSWRLDALGAPSRSSRVSPELRSASPRVRWPDFPLRYVTLRSVRLSSNESGVTGRDRTYVCRVAAGHLASRSRRQMVLCPGIEPVYPRSRGYSPTCVPALIA
jgi:hypothetical protein